MGNKAILDQLLDDTEKELKEGVEKYSASISQEEIGRAISVGQGIVWAEGLKRIKSEELVHYDNGDVSCNLKFEKLGHPDLHFAFPVTTNDKVKKHPTSNSFMQEWRQFVQETPYGSLFNWYQLLGIENKQGQIGVNEAEEIVKKLIRYHNPTPFCIIK